MFNLVHEKSIAFTFMHEKMVREVEYDVVLNSFNI